MSMNSRASGWLSWRGAVVATASGLALAACAPSEPGQEAAAPVSEEEEDVTVVQGFNTRMIETNGITLRVAEAGDADDPLIVLVHGWPESWYSWRHQIPALAEAGYHVIAPDMRGYGKSDKPADVEDYDILDTTSDIVGLLDALGEEKAIVVGHDWGSIIAWNSVLLHPDRFEALVAMSVPYGGRATEPPLARMQQAFGDNFYYILYHQEPGVAEAEYDSDPYGFLSRIYSITGAPLEPPTVTDPKRSAGGWIPRLGKPKELPPWLSEDELNYFVSEFEEAGFRGGVNYYRNFNRNWELTPQLDGATIDMPVAFIAGTDDIVINGASEEALTASMSRVANDLRDVTLIPDAGHWIQQEKPEEVNALLLQFLSGLDQ